MGDLALETRETRRWDVGPLATALEVVPNPVALSRADGELVFVNTAWTKFCGRMADGVGAVVGSSLYDLFDAHGISRVLREQQPVSLGADGQLQRVELREGLGKSSAQLQVRTRWHAYGWSGAESLLCLAVEQGAGSSAGYSRAAASVGARLTGEVAHDLNNELSILLNYTFVVAKRVPAEHPLTELLTEIQQAAWRVASLSEGLVRFGRNVERRDVQVRFSTVLDGVLPILRVAAADKCTVSLEIDDNEACCLMPRGRVEQLLVRCVLGAVDSGASRRASAPAPLLRMRLSRQQADAEPSAQMPPRAVLVVQGVPMRSLVHDSEYQGAEGSVLLSKVRDAVERCGGTMEVAPLDDGYGVVQLSFPIVAGETELSPTYRPRLEGV